MQFYWTFRGAFPLRGVPAPLEPDTSAELCQEIRQLRTLRGNRTSLSPELV